MFEKCKYTMMQECESIDYEWLTKPTGDPFADIGGIVIEYLQARKPDRSIMALIEEVTKIYVNKWDSNLHSFFLNSTITHNSNKGQKGIDKTLAYFKGLLEGKDAVEGFCRITGRKGQVFSAGRDNHIMSGSGTLINFHHGFEKGIMLSKEVLIRMLFVPLGVELLGDRVALVYSNNEKVTRRLIQKNINNNIRALSSGISKSILKSDFFNPDNALFDYANECIEDIKSEMVNEEYDRSDIDDITLNLYHFTNFGAKPTISLYTLPATVFSFYAYCLINYKREWKSFVYSNYATSKFKNAKYDDSSSKWENSKESVDYSTFKSWSNKVFYRLLKNKSLLPLFFNYVRKCSFNFKIVELYQINIRNMDKKALEKIKELADFIVNNRGNDEIEKILVQLRKAKKNNEMKNFIVKLVVKNYAEENQNPLFSVDEYVEYLFPDGGYWTDVRYILLIAVYQKLHEANKYVPMEEEETEEDGNENEEDYTNC